MKIKKYLLNCFLLLVPVFLWNIFLADFLPKGYSHEIFWNNIPNFINYFENISRIVVFALPAFMILSLNTRTQKIGITIYFIGLILYFLSWIIMIFHPGSLWSQSQIGFMAPAFTTVIWFIGIGLVGRKAFIKIPYLSTIYITISVMFVIIHSLHCYIVFERL